MKDVSLEDRVRLAAAWLRRRDKRILCVACGGLRREDEPSCTCLKDAREDRT